MPCKPGQAFSRIAAKRASRIPQNEFASLPDKFATVGKLSFSAKHFLPRDLWPEKKMSLPVGHAF
jgi:hypothetical protein